MRARVILCCALLLTGPCCGASVKTATAKPAAVDFTTVTRWAVTYGDTELGDIHATAYVNWTAEGKVAAGGLHQQVERTGHARVVLQDAFAGRQFVANKIVFDQDKNNSVIADLEGLAPASPPTAAPQTSEYPAINADAGESATIAVGGFEKVVPIHDRATAEAGHLHLTLGQSSFGVLAGEWTYLSDPLTERDRNGRGPVGAFRMLSEDEIAALPAGGGPDAGSGGFLGVQSGRMLWTPLPTRIAHVVPVEDQLEYKNGVPRYAGPNADHWRSEEQRHRTLLIIGRNLPFDLGKVLAPIESDKLAVREAHLIATADDPHLSAADKLLFDKGWNEVLSELAVKGLKTTRADASRGMDQALVSVTLTDNAFSGPKRLSWGGSRMDWLLQYGDNTLVSYLVRPLREGTGVNENQTEAASEFYLPERVAVEVRVRNIVPLETIPINAGTGSGKPLALAAHRLPGDPTLYRTEYFQVGGGGLPAANGAVLEAAIDQQKLLQSKHFQFVAIPLVKANLRTTPASDQQGRLGGLWKEALVAAAKADGLPYGDLNGLPGKPAGKARLEQPSHDGNMPNGPGTFGNVHVLVRDQAAMLLLRDAYLASMGKQLSWLRQIKSDSDLEKFREWIRPFVLYEPAAYFGQPQAPYGPTGYVKYPSSLNFILDADKDAALKAIDDLNAQLGLLAKVFKAIPGAVLNPNGTGNAASVSAFGRMEVTGIDGVPTTLYATFMHEERDEASADGPDWYRAEKLRLWHVQTMREALATYEKAVDASIKQAKRIDDADIPGLLKLTGMSFDPIVKQLLPQLMTLREGAGANGLLWVADSSARAAVLSLHTTAEAVRAQKDYSAITDQLVDQAALIALTGLLAVPAMVTEGTAASVITLAGNTLLWADNSVQEILETHRGQQDVEFEFGSAVVLGPERLAEAEIRKTDWYKTFLSVAGQGLLNVGLQARYDTLPKLAREIAAWRGEQIALQLQGIFTVRSVRALTASERADLLAFQETALLRDAEVLPLSAAEAKGVAEAEALNYEARGPPRTADDSGAFALEEQAAADETLARTGIAEPLSDTGPAEVANVKEPAAKGWVELREGQGSVEYDLGRRLGEGASSSVYEILGVRGRSPSFMAQKKVIKFVSNGIFGNAKAQIGRMKKANDLLIAARSGGAPIEFAEILEFHPEASQPYIIQSRVETGPNLVFVEPKPLMSHIWEGVAHGFPLPYEEICKLFPREMQEAVPRLFRDLTLNRLGATDLSLKNIYFKRVGQEWIAGIVDVDFIVNNERVAGDTNYIYTMLEKIKKDPGAAGMESIAWDGRYPRGVADFNEKALELRYGGNIDNPWVKFNHDTGLFEPVLIDPAMVKKYFPRFGTRPEGFAAPPRAPLPDE